MLRHLATKGATWRRLNSPQVATFNQNIYTKYVAVLFQMKLFHCSYAKLSILNSSLTMNKREKTF